MPLTKPGRVPTQPGKVQLNIWTELVVEQSGITVSQLQGAIIYTVADAQGRNVAEAAVDVAELTAAQRTTLTNLLTAIRTRVTNEAI